MEQGLEKNMGKESRQTVDSEWKNRMKEKGEGSDKAVKSGMNREEVHHSLADALHHSYTQ